MPRSKESEDIRHSNNSTCLSFKATLFTNGTQLLKRSAIQASQGVVIMLLVVAAVFPWMTSLNEYK